MVYLGEEGLFLVAHGEEMALATEVSVRFGQFGYQKFLAFFLLISDLDLAHIVAFEKIVRRACHLYLN